MGHLPVLRLSEVRGGISIIAVAAEKSAIVQRQPAFTQLTFGCRAVHVSVWLPNLEWLRGGALGLIVGWVPGGPVDGKPVNTGVSRS